MNPKTSKLLIDRNISILEFSHSDWNNEIRNRLVISKNGKKYKTETLTDSKATIEELLSEIIDYEN